MPLTQQSNDRAKHQFRAALVGQEWEGYWRQFRKALEDSMVTPQMYSPDYPKHRRVSEDRRRIRAEPGRKIDVPFGSNPDTCPVRIVQGWLEHAGITAGLFIKSIKRHGQVQASGLPGTDVARVVKKREQRAGLDAARYAGHSLRAGLATSAAIA